jgi:diaminohydroxyphosphoribosylaminopyrimidine deaminase / 5-amino-6-(5-phosphoribosylamino)uracil reductase
MDVARSALRDRHAVMLWRTSAERLFCLPCAHVVRQMNVSSPSAGSPAPNTNVRPVDDLWPILLDSVRARRACDVSILALDTLTRTADGWQLKGHWDPAARQLFDLFKPLLDFGLTGAAWVIAQLGQSLDGCVATRAGDSSFINGPENLLHLHRLRAACDAVIVGAGTVAIDNPQLTTRRVRGPNPIRVLLDPELKLAEHVKTAHLFNDGQAPTLWLCDARWRDQAVARVGADRVLAVSNLLRDDATLHLAHAVTALQTRGLTRLFVEGGGVTVSRFLAQRCLDRLHLAVAPVIIGDGRRGLQFEGPARLVDCPRPRCSVYRMGPDHLWDLDLRTSS